MTREDRQDQFKAEVQNRVGRGEFRVARGMSNSVCFLDRALMVGSLNMNSGLRARTGVPLVICSDIALSESVELHIASVISDTAAVADRLAYMQQHQALQISVGQQGELYSPFQANNKHVAFFLPADGKVSTVTTKPELLQPEMLGSLGPALQMHRFYYSVYPPTLSGKSHPAVGSFMQYVRSALGPDSVEEILLWPNSLNIDASMAQRPTAFALGELRSRIASLAGTYSDELVDSFHGGLNFLPDKHFVILTGLSGTGKTSLVGRYARAVHGIDSMTKEDPLLFICPVRPDWSDPSGLMGYLDIFTRKYVVPPFLKAVITANAFPDCAVFVCLDEMNLARVEYYFSDVLSSMETHAPFVLHTHEGYVPSDAGVEIPAQIAWPKNLYIVGTVNVDETTHSISDKVLDRAVVIDLSETRLDTLWNRLRSTNPSSSESIDFCAPILEQLDRILRPFNLTFGYRVAKEVVLLHSFSSSDADPSRKAAILDRQIAQKVLIKLRGTEKHRQMLLDLRAVLLGLPMSTALVDRLVTDLSQGWFQATSA